MILRKRLLCCALIGAASALWAADPAATPPKSDTPELQRLKEVLAKQQEQIDALKAALEEQKKALEAATSAPAASPQRATATDRLLASSTPMLAPPAAAAPARVSAPLPQKGPSENSAPLQLQLGNVTITPVGFMDATAVWRNKNAGSSIGSNFGSVPFDNAAPAGKLSEFRFSPQNSRIGFRIDGNYKGLQFMAYNENDFLGTSGANNIGVVNGAFVPRIRLFWVNVRKKNVEFLAGQSWSMFTPNRTAISPLPGDIFYSQVIDVNYMIGLPWTRQPGFRVLVHGPKDKLTFGVSLENPNQYMGGYGGGAQITLPAALTSIAGAQLDNGSAGFLSTPNLHPDVIAKLALDPSKRAHFEVGGIVRSFKVYSPVASQTFTTTGGGGEVNGNFEIVKNLRLVTNNTFGDGIGRYMFGNAPDVVVRANGALSAVHTFSTVDGFEATIAKNSLVYFYFGGLYIQKNVAVDANGTSLVGWGYAGSSNGQNHSIDEYTVGINQTLWKDAKWGAINAMAQYQYLTRSPWYVAAGGPANAADHTLYLNLRYTLPGSAPAAQK